jgi:hypothetical protein
MGCGSYFVDDAGGRLARVALIFALATLAFATTTLAQRVVPGTPAPKVPTILPPGGGASGVGGGAGLIPAMPQMRSIAPPPAAAPVAPPAAAPAAPVAPARVVRFRCEVAPEAETCREPGAPDGGGDDSECSCARDHCRPTETGIRVCE